MARALLSHRNTPDSLTGLSPAQVIFGRALRDFLPASPGRYVPRAEWRLTATNREIAHAKRHVRTEESLGARSRKLPDLSVGDTVSVQDQVGHTPRRWSKTGTVVEISGHDAYLVKMDGSNRLSKQNRQFLHRLTPFKCDTDEVYDLASPSVIPVPCIDAPDPLEDIPIAEQSPEPMTRTSSHEHSSSSMPNTGPTFDKFILQDLTVESASRPSQSSVIPEPDAPVSDTQLSPIPKSSNQLQPDASSTRLHGYMVTWRIKERWVINPKFCVVQDQNSQDSHIWCYTLYLIYVMSFISLLYKILCRPSFQSSYWSCSSVYLICM